MGFVVRCPKCGFGQEIEFESKEWLCPQCGTRIIHSVAMLISVLGMNLWVSEEQFNEIAKKTADYAKRLFAIYGQGRAIGG